MIPAPFDYVRASSIEHAVAALAEHGDDAKLLAGGHSLLPLMKLRLAVPSVLVDIGRVRDAAYVRDAGDHVAIGALTRHHDLATSGLLAAEVPILRHVAGQVGDPQVRHRGTIGGSIAHGDPASDLAAALLALDATFVVRGGAWTRELRADELFTGFLETAIRPDEVLVEVRVPKVPGRRWSFQKLSLRAQDWAIVGVACVRRPGGVAVGLVNMGPTPVRASAVEQAVAAGVPADEAAAVADRGSDPISDHGASSAYRRHLARVLVRRALADVA